MQALGFHHQERTNKLTMAFKWRDFIRLKLFCCFSLLAKISKDFYRLVKCFKRINPMGDGEFFSLEKQQQLSRLRV